MKVLKEKAFMQATEYNVNAFNYKFVPGVQKSRVVQLTSLGWSSSWSESEAREPRPPSAAPSSRTGDALRRIVSPIRCLA